jgi:uncharacterized membrane protein YphA (DoxX/SURF4 family)
LAQRWQCWQLPSCLTDLFPRLARLCGLVIGVFVADAFMLTLGGKWLDATPHLRLQGIAMAVTFVLVTIAGTGSASLDGLKSE